MAEPLTQMEKRVYHFLIDYLAENTFQPSIREIAKKFRIKSTKTVSDLLKALEDKGYIARDQSRSRGVRLLGFASVREIQPVPVFGRIRAGSAGPSPEDCVAHVTVDRRFLPGPDAFYLEVSGHSMAGRGILSGDYVLIAPSGTPKDGDIVAVRVRGNAMVKTLTHQGDTVVLEAAAPGEPKIEVDPSDDYAVLGVVCGLYRPFRGDDH